MKLMKELYAGFVDACIRVEVVIHRQCGVVMFAAGFALLLSGLGEVANAQPETFHEASYWDPPIRNAVGNLLGFVEGSFGALIMVVAGLGAIVSAAMGAYRGAVAMLVVAIGAFILRSLVSLFFGTNFISMNAGGEEGI